MRNFMKLFVLALALTVASSAEAFLIVNTGDPTSLSGPGFGRSSDTDAHFIAGQFTTGQNYVIKSVEGAMSEAFGGSGNAEAVIYGDDNGLPDTAVEFFRQTFAIPAFNGSFESTW